MRINPCIIAAVAVFILFHPLVAEAKFKLYVDDSRKKYIMVEEQDCSVYRSEDGKISLGFKAGGLFFGIGPEITFGKEYGINWNNLTQRLVARYLELCTRFNTGSISKAEYDKRLKTIETIETKAYELYKKMLEETTKRNEKMFKELDDAEKNF
tara:strand:- start:297 stop:758 length:462 start_codon:yes stop_codon:yes gene_type:complete